MRRPTIRPLLCAFVALSLFTAHAEEPVRSVQEELRRRNIYFGDVDGRATPELEQAVKRYQKRKGFESTGHADAETLRSLALLPRSADEPPPKELEWPQEPVLRSDGKIDVAAATAQLAEETGVAPEAIAVGEPDAPTKRRTKGTSRVTVAPQRGTATPRISRRGTAASPDFDPRELNAFIAGYLSALGQRDLRDELRYYADDVNYFANGRIDRRIVEQSLRSYYQRWTSRKYRLAGALRFAFNPKQAEIVVLFEVKFTLRGKGKAVEGRTLNRIVIDAATADPRIVAIEEQRIRG